MNSKKIILAIITIIVLVIGCKKETFTNSKTTHHNSPVLDKIDLLSFEEKDDLNKMIRKIENEIGSQIGILIINSTGNKSIEEYSIQQAEIYKLGRAEINDGVLITLAKEDRQTRIEVGYGLEKIIKDEIAYYIIRDKMIEHFKNENYYLGLKDAITEISALLNENIDLVGNLDGILVEK